MMEYAEWERYYLQIVREFGFSIEMDRKASIILAELMKSKETVDEEYLRNLISGKDVLIAGPLTRKIIGKDIIIATDTSTKICLRMGVVPDIIVTDLDGDIEDEIKASIMGSITLIHGHGDNIENLRRYVPKFKGKIGGTVQSEPFPPLMNFGGFTDGDRAAFIADSLGAGRIYITGFDLNHPVEKKGVDMEAKRRKLLWAKRLLNLLDVSWI